MHPRQLTQTQKQERDQTQMLTTSKESRLQSSHLCEFYFEHQIIYLFLLFCKNYLNINANVLIILLLEFFYFIFHVTIIFCMTILISIPIQFFK